MKPILLSLIVFACVFGGAVVGMVLRPFLPERHLSEESKNVITLGMGLIATMAALALGFLIAGAQSSFRDQRSDLIEMSAKIVFLDKILADYGPETKEARATLRSSLERTIDQFWPRDGSEPARLVPEDAKTETVYNKILALTPHRDAQRSLRDEALSVTYDLAQSRDSLIMAQNNSFPGAFLIVLGLLVFWFVAIFFSFGLYAPTNSTVVSTLIISALSVSIAIFMIVELNLPFKGILRMPSTPMVEALDHIGK